MWFDGKNKEQEKKQKTAVAVAYEPGDAAPKILAAGKGEVAEGIIEKAKEINPEGSNREKKMMYRFIRIIS